MEARTGVCFTSRPLLPGLLLAVLRAPGVADAVCGDAIIDAGEECDDGNVGPGDGCGVTCLLEAGVADACSATDEDELDVCGTDPDNPDTEGDGLLDGREVNAEGTDPLDADTDDDSLGDGAEVLDERTDPLDPDSAPVAVHTPTLCTNLWITLNGFEPLS